MFEKAESNPKDTPPDHPDFVPPKKGNRKVKNPNGTGWGWLDKKGDVWVWNPNMHGGEGWVIQEPNGGHRHAYPGGSTREHFESVSITTPISIFPENQIVSHILSNPGAIAVGGMIAVCYFAMEMFSGHERNMR